MIGESDLSFEVAMNFPHDTSILEKLDDGVILRQLDDLCFVQVGSRRVDAAQTRHLGEKLIAFIERAGCRKLVMSFEGVESIYGFLLEEPPLPRPSVRRQEKPIGRSERMPVGSDLWLG
jgi:hypothetical protein